MQRLVYENACEALGLRLHDSTCPAAAAGAASPARSCGFSSAFASSSSAWFLFLSI